jgi:hypothetical protein
VYGCDIDEGLKNLKGNCLEDLHIEPKILGYVDKYIVDSCMDDI